MRRRYHSRRCSGRSESGRDGVITAVSRRAELVPVDRLGDQPVEAGLHQQRARVALPERGAGEHRHVGGLGLVAQRLEDLEPVAAGQEDVEQDDVGRIAHRARDRFAGGARALDHEAGRASRRSSWSARGTPLRRRRAGPAAGEPNEASGANWSIPGQLRQPFARGMCTLHAVDRAPARSGRNAPLVHSEPFGDDCLCSGCQRRQDVGGWIIMARHEPAAHFLALTCPPRRRARAHAPA